MPLYDAFDSSAGNTERVRRRSSRTSSLTERRTPNATPELAAARQRLPLDDARPRAAARTSTRILWQYVHGKDSKPPPPGPNASGEDEESFGGER